MQKSLNAESELQRVAVQSGLNRNRSICQRPRQCQQPGGAGKHTRAAKEPKPQFLAKEQSLAQARLALSENAEAWARNFQTQLKEFKKKYGIDIENTNVRASCSPSQEFIDDWNNAPQSFNDPAYEQWKTGSLQAQYV